MPAMTFDKILKYNHNHDARGRFASANSAGNGGNAERIAELKAQLKTTVRVPVFSNGEVTRYITNDNGKIKLTDDKSKAIPITDKNRDKVNATLEQQSKKKPLYPVGEEDVERDVRMPYAQKKAILDEISALERGFDSASEMNAADAKRKQETYEKQKAAVENSYFTQNQSKDERFYYDVDGDIICNYSVAARTIAREAQRQGAEITHTSATGSDKFASSVYLKRGETEIRVSDHALPMTDERTNRGGTRWDGELVLNNYGLINLAGEIKTKQDLEKFVDGLFKGEDFGKTARKARIFEDVLKFNHNHGADGKFTTAEGAGGGGRMVEYISGLKPAVEYPERVEYWKEQIKAGNERPILVSDKDENRIIDGNHTLAAYKELGKTPKVYAMDRVTFLNEAAEADDTVAYIEQAIKDGKAKEVKKAAAFTEILKFNPYHGYHGYFSTAEGATFTTNSTKYGPGQKAIDNIKRSKVSDMITILNERKAKMEADESNKINSSGYSKKVISMMGEAVTKEYDTGDHPNKYDPDDPRWGTEPGTYTVYRSGGLDRDIVFTASTMKGSELYADSFPESEGGIDPKRCAAYTYTVEIKKPFVSKDMPEAYEKLFGKKVNLDPSPAQIKKGITTGDLWVKADEKIAAKLKKMGYDAWTMTSPAPPAKKEMNILAGAKSTMKETGRKVPDHIKKIWAKEAEKDGFYTHAYKDGKEVMTIDEWFKTDDYKAGKEAGKWA